MSAALPDLSTRLKSLVQLDLNENELEGEIPAVLGKLKDLHRLYLGDNLLQGEIPQELLGPDMIHLKKVDLSNNKLKGYVPLGVCKMAELLLLKLSGNAELEGVVPECNAPYGPYADEENRKHCKSQVRVEAVEGEDQGNVWRLIETRRVLMHFNAVSSSCTIQTLTCPTCLPSGLSPSRNA
eukprot:748237-Hanusia_phi.AAC.7